MICSNCGVKNNDTAKFCDECGSALPTNAKSTNDEIETHESTSNQKLKLEFVGFFKKDLTKPIIFGTLSMVFAYYVLSKAKSAPHPIYMFSISNFFIGLGGFLAVILTDNKKLVSLLSALITAVITTVLLSLYRLFNNPHSFDTLQDNILYLLGLLYGNGFYYIYYGLIGGFLGFLVKNIFVWIKNKIF